MKIYEIQSSKNENFKLFQTLLTGKGIGESGQALIFGKRATDEILAHHLNQLRGVIALKEMPQKKQWPALYAMNEKLFRDLDIFGIGEPIYVVNVPKIEKLSSKFEFSECNLVIPFQDPSNVGAVIRSAVAFGVKTIILGPGVAHPFHPRSSRAASGTLFLPRFYRAEDYTFFAEQKNIPLFALDKKGHDLRKIKFPKNFFLVPGVEGLGVDEKILEISQIVSVPTLDVVESLNANVATSVALFHWYSQNF